MPQEALLADEGIVRAEKHPAGRAGLCQRKDCIVVEVE